MKYTELSALGEFGLIDHLTRDIKLKNTSSLKGVGDDAAILDYSGKQLLVSTDMLIQGIHFDLTYTPLKHLGYKSVAVNASDIYAMNGTPRQITLALAVSNHFSVEGLEEFYAGVYAACERYGIDLVGGDTTSSKTGMCISITVLGEAEADEITRRDTARPNELICVSGDLGAAYMGLQLLEREKLVFKGNEEAQPDFAGYEYILERQLKPEARKDIVELLKEKHIKPTAMIDVSDGLASEVMHICKDSGVGCNIYEDRIPIDYQTFKMAEELNMNATVCALSGGEDYELLFTAPLAQYDLLTSLPDIKVIGHTTPDSEGCRLTTRDGNSFELKAQGWTNFSTDNHKNDSHDLQCVEEGRIEEFADALYKTLLLELDEEEEESIETAELAYIALCRLINSDAATPEHYKRRLLLLHYFNDYFTDAVIEIFLSAYRKEHLLQARNLALECIDKMQLADMFHLEEHEADFLEADEQIADACNAIETDPNLSEEERRNAALLHKVLYAYLKAKYKNLPPNF